MSLLDVEATAQVTLATKPPMVTPDLLGGNKIGARISRSRRKLLRFIALETSALLLLVTSIIAGTSPALAQEGLTLPFEILLWVAISAITVIPVFFYGLPRRGFRVRRY
ncbi:MAG: hypothetical protein QOE73_1504 [Verrucomicrobiota bacterium]|jgi:hypothetical protein